MGQPGSGAFSECPFRVPVGLRKLLGVSKGLELQAVVSTVGSGSLCQAAWEAAPAILEGGGLVHKLPCTVVLKGLDVWALG